MPELAENLGFPNQRRIQPGRNPAKMLKGGLV
jgi:hypothetical protein